MTEEERKELISILENQRGNLYDFVANKGYTLERADLVALAKECISLLYVYASRVEPNTEKANKDMHKELMENIHEWQPQLLSEE